MFNMNGTVGVADGVEYICGIGILKTLTSVTPTLLICGIDIRSLVPTYLS